MRTFIVETLHARADIVTAADPQEALDVISRSGPYRVDAVLVGWLIAGPRRPGCMPFVLKVFDEWPWVPIVVLCPARQVERLRAETLVTGVRSFLRTPFTGVQLRRSLEPVVTRHGPGGPGSASMIRVMKRVRDYVADHLADAPRLDDLSVIAGMSRTAFSRRFHAVVGVSLRQHLRDLRLRQATNLLLTTRLAITDIAVESGFYDLPHLDKAFRKRLGTSPVRFRRRHARRARGGT
jgi:AraC-like DNA-binding protein